MVFSSALFLFVFLPVFLLVYHLLGHNWRNYWMLLASLLFYAWGAPVFVFGLLFSLTANYLIVKAMHQRSSGQKRLLYLSVGINLGLLAYFKYTNFFVDNFNAALSSTGMEPIGWTNVALPIGISFFTFQSITYTVDIYRGASKPLRRFTDYLLYILMFPQLIAGPIVRFNTIAGALTDRRSSETIDHKLSGFYRFTIGLAKKILIANTLGLAVEKIDALPIQELDSTVIWLGNLAYAFQLYFDFSGYTDMAIGLGLILGFKFPENFNSPYTATSITDFWRRWHITLSEWMRDYLYIPLGGNRVKSQLQLYVNLSTVFLLSGLWHGANWTFVFWGAWHGLFLILERIFLARLLVGAGRFLATLFTFLIVLIGWVFFRADHFAEGWLHFKIMFSFRFSSLSIELGTEFWLTILIAGCLAFATLSKWGRQLENLIYSEHHRLSHHLLAFPLVVLVFLLCTIYLSSTGFNPFIYFRF